MITAVDTSVLLDVFRADPEHGEGSREALRSASIGGQLVACDVVWAETLAHFPSPQQGRDALDTLRVTFAPLEAVASETAARAWRRYHSRGGSKTRVIADFLIGAHAQCQADRLLTRDRGFYRVYFAELRVLDPSGRGARRKRAGS